MSGAEIEQPPVAATTEGQPNTLEATGTTAFGQCGATGKRKMGGPFVGFRSAAGRTWHYEGKRARVLAMLASSPDGLTQWDTLPWHTRLGGTIHVFRKHGLSIETVLEGDYRHARYWLRTHGWLLKQAKNRRTP